MLAAYRWASGEPGSRTIEAEALELCDRFGAAVVLGQPAPAHLLRRLLYFDNMREAYRQRQKHKNELKELDPSGWDAEHPYWAGQLGKGMAWRWALKRIKADGSREEAILGFLANDRLSAAELEVLNQYALKAGLIDRQTALMVTGINRVCDELNANQNVDAALGIETDNR